VYQEHEILSINGLAFLAQPVLSRGMYAAKLAYSQHCHWGVTVLMRRS